MKIIGSKNKIAVKVERVDNSSGNNIYGKVLLYIDGKEIGYFDESINLRVFVSQFLRLTNPVVELQELNDMSDADALATIIESDDEVFDGCILSLGESFDDFEIRFFGTNEGVRIVWRMVADTYYRYLPDDNSRSGGIVLTKEEVWTFFNLLRGEILPS